MVVQPTLPLGQQSLLVLWLFTSSIGQRTKLSYNVVRCEGFSLGSKKGFLIAALFLLTLPIILNLPGLLSFHILGEGLNPMDTSYPLLVNKVMPTALQGFFIAALFGAIFKYL